MLLMMLSENMVLTFKGASHHFVHLDIGVLEKKMEVDSLIHHTVFTYFLTCSNGNWKSSGC